MIGTHTNWGPAEFQAKSMDRAVPKVPLTFRGNNDGGTGHSLRNARNQVIDFPLDVNRKHRTERWDFQQTYRSTATIPKPLTGTTHGDGSEAHKGNNELSNQPTIDGVQTSKVNINQNSIINSSSLHNSLKKRLKLRNLGLTGIRYGEFTSKSRSKKINTSRVPVPVTEQQSQRNELLYSSQSNIRKGIYDKIKETDHRLFLETQRKNYDNRKIEKTFQKFGSSLEKLPDIRLSDNRLQHQQSRSCKLFGSFNDYQDRRDENQTSAMKMPSLQSSKSSEDNVGLNNFKLPVIVNRPENETLQATLESSEYTEEGDTDPQPDYCDDDDDDDDDYDDDIGKNEREEESENNATCSKMHQEHMIGIDSEENYPDQNDIKQSVSMLKPRDETQNIKQSLEESKVSEANNVQGCGNTDLRLQPSSNAEEKQSKVSIKRNLDINDKSLAKNSSKILTSCSIDGENNKDAKPTQDNNVIVNNLEGKDRYECDEDLDIPEDRFGHTTHSVDKKLSIRRPWEWRPSPYRWINRDSVRESDKPYIERIINKGEMIDEFEYDSFARTKPLKVQSLPEGSGYKDRYGVVR